MTFLAGNDRERRQQLQLAAETPSDPEAFKPGFFEGSLDALGTAGGRVLGVTAQLAGEAEYQVGSNLITKPVDYLFDTDLTGFLNETLRENPRAYTASMTPDPQTTGFAGQVLYGLVGIGVPAIVGGIYGGPGGAAMMAGGFDAVGTSADLQAQGVDPDTAALAGAGQGVFTAAGVAAPAALGGRLLTSTLLYGPGINVAQDYASRYTVAATLSANGYDELAGHYAEMDNASLAADVVLGAAFGFAGARAGRPEPRRPVLTSEKDAALTAQDARHTEIDAAPGVPATMDALNDHVRNLVDATASLLAGEPVKIKEAGGDFLEKPASEFTPERMIDAMKATGIPEFEGIGTGPALSGIRGEIHSQLLAARVDPVQADAYATLYDAVFSTLAKRTGQSAADLWGRYGVQVQRGTVEDVRGGVVLNQPVYHGTPHRGIEQTGFSLQKIGTGEGAQAYGWGLYFAGDKEIAEYYRKSLTDTSRVATIQFNDKSGPAKVSERGFVTHLMDAFKDKNSFRNEVDELSRQVTKVVVDGRSVGAAKAAILPRDWPLFESMLAYAQTLGVKKIKPEPQGQLYKAEVPEDGDLLDYDKQFSEQPAKVQEAMQAIVDAGLLDEENTPVWKAAKNKSGMQFYTLLTTSFKVDGAEGASKVLAQYGIPGLRFLDANSRATGKGSHNYVIWDESQIKDVQAFYQSGKGDPVTKTPEFRNWFGDSKVVDGKGEPLVVYHGTRTKGAAIESFDPAKAGTNTDSGYMGKGFYFSDARTANVYAGHSEIYPELFPQGGVVYPVFLSLKNPVILTDRVENGRRVDLETLARNAAGLPKTASSDEVRSALMAMGHDGAIYQVGSKDGYREYVAFRPEQIKSATGNRGTFDPNDPSILNQAERGAIQIAPDRTMKISLFDQADASTFLHESGHLFLEVLGDLADKGGKLGEDYAATLKWLGVANRGEIQVAHHEQFARGFEAYLREGKAPTPELKTVFDKFRDWLVSLYKKVTDLDVTLSDDIRGVFDRLIAMQDEPLVKPQTVDETARDLGGRQGSQAGAEKDGFLTNPPDGDISPDLKPDQYADADIALAEQIMAEVPDLSILDDDGQPVRAADALKAAEGVLARAREDAKGYAAAIGCFLRNGA